MKNLLGDIRSAADSLQYNKIIDIIKTGGPSHADIGDIFTQLLDDERYQAAEIVGKMADSMGIEQWTIQAFLAYSSFYSDKFNDGYAALGRLSDTYDLLQETSGSEVEYWFKQPVIRPIIRFLIESALAGTFSRPQIKGMTEIVKVLFPGIARIMDGPLNPRNDPYAKDNRDGEGQLLAFERPPKGMARPRRSVVLGMRRLMFPERQGSREFEMPPRFAVAMRNYGWDFSFHPIDDWTDPDAVREHLVAIAEQCRSSKADLLILESEFDPHPADSAKWLRQALPDTAIILYYGDPWKHEFHANIRKAAPFVDGLWSVMPMTPVWSEPGIAEKALFFPHPSGGYTSPAITPLQPRLNFVGGIEAYNWSRAVWLAQIRDEGMDISIALSAHQDDGLDTLESFHRYLTRISQYGASINFSLRKDLCRTLTGRTFEVPCANALLVQEQSPDVDCYMVAGRDYLRFETMSDLRNILRFMKERPDEAEDVRRRGHDLFLHTYDDDSIISYFDAFLMRTLTHL